MNSRVCVCVKERLDERRSFDGKVLGEDFNSAYQHGEGWRSSPVLGYVTDTNLSIAHIVGTIGPFP